MVCRVLLAVALCLFLVEASSQVAWDSSYSPFSGAPELGLLLQGILGGTEKDVPLVTTILLESVGSGSENLRSLAQALNCEGVALDALDARALSAEKRLDRALRKLAKDSPGEALCVVQM